MLHVFNGPVEPVTLAEFQKSKGKKTVFSCHTKEKVTYHEDGRRFVGDKIESEESAHSLWSTVLARSVAQDLKNRSEEDATLRSLGIGQCVFYWLQQLVPYRNMRTTFVLIAVNVVLILLFIYIFVF